MNEAGNLVVGNLGLNGQDRVCTELPDVNGVQVQLARPSFALPEKGDQVLLTSRRCMYPICGGVWLVDLHRKPNGTMEGFMDYTDDACNGRPSGGRYCGASEGAAPSFHEDVTRCVGYRAACGLPCDTLC